MKHVQSPPLIVSILKQIYERTLFAAPEWWFFNDQNNNLKRVCAANEITFSYYQIESNQEESQKFWWYSEPKEINTKNCKYFLPMFTELIFIMLRSSDHIIFNDNITIQSDHCLCAHYSFLSYNLKQQSAFPPRTLWQNRSHQSQTILLFFYMNNNGKTCVYINCKLRRLTICYKLTFLCQSSLWQYGEIWWKCVFDFSIFLR